MTPTTDPEAGQAFTRASVERYLRAAAAEQARLESAIAGARARTEAARQVEEHLRSLDPGPDRQAGPDLAGTADGRLPFEVDTDEHALAGTGWSDGSRP